MKFQEALDVKNSIKQLKHEIEAAEERILTKTESRSRSQTVGSPKNANSPGAHCNASKTIETERS